MGSESSNLWCPRACKNRVSSVGGWGKWVSLREEPLWPPGDVQLLSSGALGLGGGPWMGVLAWRGGPFLLGILTKGISFS